MKSLDTISVVTPLASGPFQLLQPDWVQISPRGDFHHPNGLQRVDQQALDLMVTHFHSFPARLGRGFAGLPFYIGHPDAPTPERNYRDEKAYGWILSLEQRPEGLFGKIKWSNSGRALLQEGHYRFLSPYWEAEEIGLEKGQKVFRPVRLLSVGLTNHPNLPLQPLSNQGQANAVHSGQRAEIDGLLLEALLGGRISPAQAELWRAKLQNDFSEAAKSLSREQALPMQPRRFTNHQQHGPARRDKLQQLVQGKVQQGMSYDQAWEAVKREHWALFEEMN